MSGKKQSEVWNHFKSGKEQNTANCNLCSQVISCKQSNTTTMKRHLFAMHKVGITELSKEDRRPKKTKTLESVVKRTTLEEIVAKLAATDGISIRAITNSEGIRTGISFQGFKLPKCESDVMKLVHNFAESKRLEIIEEIESEIARGHKFSITLDEWTSFATRRYLNINLHKIDSSIINLGLVRILGSCNADKMVEIVENHLKFFKLSYDHDIVAASGDRGSVMIAFGERSPALYQVCLAHGIHPGVFHSLYKGNDTASDYITENSKIQD